MQFKLFFLLALTFLVPLSFATNGATGFLGEVIPWPQQPPIVYKHLSFTSTPPAGVTVFPTGKNIQYATIGLGNGDINIAVQLSEEPRVWVDENNNGNLCDDRGGKPDDQGCQGFFGWYFKVQVPYKVNGQSFKQPYYLTISGQKTSNEWRFDYVCGGLRKGLINLGGTLYDIYIGDRNSDGLYNDCKNLTVFIDVNHDGKIAWYNQVYEVFSPPTFPIQVGENVYTIKSADPAGRVIDLEKTDEAPLPSVLTPGHPAPDFTAGTVDGNLLTLSDYRSKVVVLLFVPFRAYQNASSCSSCTKPDLLQRALDLQKVVRSEPNALRNNIAIIGISTDPKAPSSSLIKELGVEFPVVWDLSLAKLYCLSTMLVLDQKGSIQLTDNYMVKFSGARITNIQYCHLEAWQIMEKVEQLLK